MTMSCPRAVTHLVIGRHHFGRCLHIFTMATVLEKDKKTPLNFTSGTILALEPTPVTKAPANYNYALVLHNQKGDILLHIQFSKGSIIVVDRARRSLGDGWGKRQIVDMTHVNLKGRSVLGVKVSIHHYLTDSEFGKYHILLNGLTICHFEKRFPGPAAHITYVVGTAGPPSWDVDVYRIDDLPPEERLALLPERQVGIAQCFFIADKTSDPPCHQVRVLIQWRFLFGHPISFQLKHMHLSVGMMGKRCVCYDIESWSLFQIGSPDQIVLSRAWQCFARVCPLGEQGQE